MKKKGLILPENSNLNIINGAGITAAMEELEAAPTPENVYVDLNKIVKNKNIAFEYHYTVVLSSSNQDELLKLTAEIIKLNLGMSKAEIITSGKCHYAFIDWVLT